MQCENVSFGPVRPLPDALTRGIIRIILKEDIFCLI
jgi:hypothetical protein